MYIFLKIRVISEDRDLIVIDKPAELIVHSDGRTTEPSLAEWIGERYPHMRGVGGDWISPQGEHVPLNGLVHRLDRATSGVIVAAKNQETFDYLKDEFRARRVEKVYHALVHGHLQGESGTIIAEIARTNTVPKRWYAQPVGVENKRAAITDWHVCERYENDTTLLELRPRTGRTHQLRVHLASIGHPIVGDHLYGHGMPEIQSIDRLALHAYKITFTLHGTQESFTAVSPVMLQ